MQSSNEEKPLLKSPNISTSGIFTSQELVIIATNITIHNGNTLLYTGSKQHDFSQTVKLFITYSLYGLLLAVSKDNRCKGTHFINMYYTLANTVGF